MKNGPALAAVSETAGEAVPQKYALDTETYTHIHPNMWVWCDLLVESVKRNLKLTEFNVRLLQFKAI